MKLKGSYRIFILLIVFIQSNPLSQNDLHIKCDSVSEEISNYFQMRKYNDDKKKGYTLSSSLKEEEFQKLLKKLKEINKSPFKLMAKFYPGIFVLEFFAIIVQIILVLISIGYLIYIVLNCIDPKRYSIDNKEIMNNFYDNSNIHINNILSNNDCRVYKEMPEDRKDISAHILLMNQNILNQKEIVNRNSVIKEIENMKEDENKNDNNDDNKKGSSSKKKDSSNEPDIDLNNMTQYRFKFIKIMNPSNKKEVKECINQGTQFPYLWALYLCLTNKVFGFKYYKTKIEHLHEDYKCIKTIILSITFVLLIANLILLYTNIKVIENVKNANIDTLCSVNQFFENIQNGESSEISPKYIGFPHIYEVFENLNNKKDEVLILLNKFNLSYFNNTQIYLNEWENEKSEAIDKMKNSGDFFFNSYKIYEFEYKDNFPYDLNHKYQLKLIYNYYNGENTLNKADLFLKNRDIINLVKEFKEIQLKLRDQLSDENIDKINIFINELKKLEQFINYHSSKAINLWENNIYNKIKYFNNIIKIMNYILLCFNGLFLLGLFVYAEWTSYTKKFVDKKLIPIFFHGLLFLSMISVVIFLCFLNYYKFYSKMINDISNFLEYIHSTEFFQKYKDNTFNDLYSDKNEDEIKLFTNITYYLENILNSDGNSSKLFNFTLGLVNLDEIFLKIRSYESYINDYDKKIINNETFYRNNFLENIHFLILNKSVTFYDLNNEETIFLDITDRTNINSINPKTLIDIVNNYLDGYNRNFYNLPNIDVNEIWALCCNASVETFFYVKKEEAMQCRFSCFREDSKNNLLFFNEWELNEILERYNEFNNTYHYQVIKYYFSILDDFRKMGFQNFNNLKVLNFKLMKIYSNIIQSCINDLVVSLDVTNIYKKEIFKDYVGETSHITSFIDLSFIKRDYTFLISLLKFNLADSLDNIYVRLLLNVILEILLFISIIIMHYFFYIQKEEKGLTKEELKKFNKTFQKMKKEKIENKKKSQSNKNIPKANDFHKDIEILLEIMDKKSLMPKTDLQLDRLRNDGNLNNINIISIKNDKK